MTRTKNPAAKNVPNQPNLARTSAALVEWEARQPAIEAMFSAAMTNEAVYAAQAAERASDLLVKEAFALDTADRNSRENAMLVSPNSPFLRRAVNSWRAQNPTG